MYVHVCMLGCKPYVYEYTCKCIYVYACKVFSMYNYNT